METLMQTRQTMAPATPAQQNLYQVASTADGWERARLIACSIEQVSSNGFVIQPYGDVGKILADDAAELCGVPTRTLKRILRAWNLAAIAGHCESSGALRPEDSPSAVLPDNELWNTYWNLSAT